MNYVPDEPKLPEDLLEGVAKLRQRWNSTAIIAAAFQLGYDEIVEKKVLDPYEFAWKLHRGGYHTRLTNVKINGG